MKHIASLTVLIRFNDGCIVATFWATL